MNIIDYSDGQYSYMREHRFGVDLSDNIELFVPYNTLKSEVLTWIEENSPQGFIDMTHQRKKAIIIFRTLAEALAFKMAWG